MSVKSSAQLKVDIIASIYENTSEQVTAQNEQNRLTDMVDSFYNRLEDIVMNVTKRIYDSTMASYIDVDATKITLSSMFYVLLSMTANTVPYLDGSKILQSSAVTPTELSYVHNVTSSIQAQLNAITAAGLSGTLTSGTLPVASGAHTLVNSYLVATVTHGISQDGGNFFFDTDGTRTIIGTSLYQGLDIRTNNTTHLRILRDASTSGGVIVDVPFSVNDAFAYVGVSAVALSVGSLGSGAATGIYSPGGYGVMGNTGSVYVQAFGANSSTAGLRAHHNPASYDQPGSSTDGTYHTYGFGLDADTTAKIIVQGIGATSSTYSIILQNGSASKTFAVRDNGWIEGGNITSGSLSIGHNSASDMSSLYNTFIGYASGQASNGSTRNVGVGTNSLTSITTAQRMTAVGDSSLISLLTGLGTTAIGWGALELITDSNDATAIGYAALQSQTINYGNTAVGSGAGSQVTTGTGHALFGLNAWAFGTTGLNNAVFGDGAFRRNVTGSQNTVLGATAGHFAIAAASDNVFVGYEAGYFNNDTGNGSGTVGRNRNVFIGSMSGQSSISADSIFIGYNSGITETNNDRFILANNTNTLLYGRFDTKVLGIGTVTPTATIHIKGIGATSATYSLKVENSSASMFYVRDDGQIQVGVGSRLFLDANPTSALEAVTKQYADALVVGLWDDRGNWDASGNLFPTTGGSGTAGAVLKGDIWTVNVPGTLGGTTVANGDTLRALVDTPGQTAGNWALGEHDIGYTPLSNTLTSAYIFVGSAGNVATGVAMSGDITISNAGVTAIGASKVLNAMINSVAWSKITSTPTTLSGYGITDAISTTLASGKILLGSNTNLAAAVNIAKDAVIDNVGNLTVSSINSVGITLAGAFQTSGAYTLSLTATAATAVTLPTSGTLFSDKTGSITSAQLLAALTDETGTGHAVFDTSPTFITKLTSPEVDISGTGGAGFINLVAQSSNAAAPSATGLNLFSVSTGGLAWAKKNGSDTYVRNFSSTLTADRTYTLQDASGTIAFLTDCINQALTGYVSGAGTVASTDTILQAIQKLNGNFILAESGYNTLLHSSLSLTTTNAAGTYGVTGTGQIQSGSAVATIPAIIYIASADFPSVNGLTPKLRIRAMVATNHTAPTGNFTFGLYPFTQPASSGGAGVRSWTIGTVVSGSTGATVSAPAADTTSALVSADFALPADGWYGVCVVTTQTPAALSFVEMLADLQIHYT